MILSINYEATKKLEKQIQGTDHGNQGKTRVQTNSALAALYPSFFSISLICTLVLYLKRLDDLNCQAVAGLRDALELSQFYALERFEILSGRSWVFCRLLLGDSRKKPGCSVSKCDYHDFETLREAS